MCACKHMACAQKHVLALNNNVIHQVAVTSTLKLHGGCRDALLDGAFNICAPNTGVTVRGNEARDCTKISAAVQRVASSRRSRSTARSRFRTSSAELCH
jgi:hypothetical protein